MREFFLSYKGLLIFFIIGTILFGGLIGLLSYQEKISPQKQVSPYQKQIEQLDSILASVNILNDPLDSRISKEEFESKKRGIEFEIQAVKEAFAKGEMQEARKIMYRTEQSSMGTVVYGILGPILALGDPLQSKFVPPDIKKDHDPKDKYIGKSRVDPRIMNQYLKVIKVLVAIDKNY